MSIRNNNPRQRAKAKPDTPALRRMLTPVCTALAAAALPTKLVIPGNGEGFTLSSFLLSLNVRNTRDRLSVTVGKSAMNREDARRFLAALGFTVLPGVDEGSLNKNKKANNK